MSDWDDFTAEVESLSDHYGNRSKCGMRAFLATLGEGARADVEAALARSDITSTGLAEALRRRVGDSAPSDFTIRRHRRGRCRCARNGDTDE